MSVSNASRLNKLDALRGLTLISMILYHAMWDVVYIYRINIPWYGELPGSIWQQSICWTFILLSGLSLSLGHHPVKRGLMVSLCGLVITIVTLIFLPEDVVIFGILTFMGAAMILCSFVDRLNIDKRILLFVSLLLFFLTRGVCNTAYSFGNYLTAFIGFPFAGFFSTDYFPLIPWFFLYLAGYSLSFLLTDKVKGVLSGELCPHLEFIGRHTLIIYMLHQPVIMLVLSVFLK